MGSVTRSPPGGGLPDIWPRGFLSLWLESPGCFQTLCSDPVQGVPFLLLQSGPWGGRGGCGFTFSDPQCFPFLTGFLWEEGEGADFSGCGP